MEKTCTRCNVIKPLEEFAKSKQTKSGYGAWCKPCTNAARRESAARVRAANPEAYAKRQREYTKKYKQRHPDRVKEKDRIRNLAYTYGITIEKYEEMLQEQKGRCAICYDIPRNKRFAVDHDHKCCDGKRSCGKCVRRLLCHRCNTALGLVHEDQNIIEQMLEYVKNNGDYWPFRVR